MGTETVNEYIDQPYPPIADDELVVQVWLHTADGGVLWGFTCRRGPFDDLDALQAQLDDWVPWERLEPGERLRNQFVQHRLL